MLHTGGVHVLSASEHVSMYLFLCTDGNEIIIGESCELELAISTTHTHASVSIHAPHTHAPVNIHASHNCIHTRTHAHRSLKDLIKLKGEGIG